MWRAELTARSAVAGVFPLSFAFGYSLARRWPIVGGCIALACMAASLLIIVGRVFPMSVYAIWGVLSLPGILLVVRGWKLRGFGRAV